MSQPPRILVFGFLTVTEILGRGWFGGYLLTNEHGRPIEFHHTSPLVISTRQRLLFGTQFESSLIEAIAKPVTDRQRVAPCAVFVREDWLLDLRRCIPAPVLAIVKAAGGGEAHPHSDYREDQLIWENLAGRVGGSFDWIEPFTRVQRVLEEIAQGSVEPSAIGTPGHSLRLVA